MTKDAGLLGSTAEMFICSFTDFADIALDVNGQLFRFEFSKRFGPFMIGKRGRTIGSVPPTCSAFWDALQAWCKQGYQVVDGRCVFVVPPRPVYVRLAGNKYVEVPEGRDPQDVRREWLIKAGLSNEADR